MDTLEIKILNYKKYNNTRKEIKSTSWVRVNNTIWSDDDFEDFSALELTAWIYLLTKASVKMCDVITVNLKTAERLSRVPMEQFKTAIEKLNKNSSIAIIRSTYAAHTQHASSAQAAHTLRNGTERNERTNERDAGTPRLAPRRASKNRESKSSKVWESYRQSYLVRWKQEPIRNAQVNSKLCQLVDKLGQDLAAEVIAFYVRHNDRFYVTKMHPVGLAVSDAEKLATEYRNGQTMTGAKAREIEKVGNITDAIDAFVGGVSQ